MSTVTKTWKVIEEFPAYKVSNYGEIKHARTGKLVCINTSGVNPTVQLNKAIKSEHTVRNNIHTTRKVCDLVARAFLIPEEDKGEWKLSHFDGNTHNNHSSNLRWILKP